MTIANIQQELSTQDGFAKKVSARNPWLTAGIVCIVAAIGLLLFNIWQLGSVSDWDGGYIGRYLFLPEAVSFSGTRSGRSEIFRFIAVWGPVVLLPVGIICIVVYFVTRSQSAAGLFATYQARGFVGRQAQTPLQVGEGRATVRISLIAGPNVSDEDFGAAVQRFNGYASSLDKKGARGFAATASKAGVLKGTSAANLVQGIPPEIIAGRQTGKTPYLVVIPPEKASGSFKLLPIREES